MESFTEWYNRNLDALNQIMTEYNVSLAEAILILNNLIERNRNDKAD